MKVKSELVGVVIKGVLAVAAVVAIVVLYKGNQQTGVVAHAATATQTNWQATSLLTMTVPWSRGSTSGSSVVALGPASWHVDYFQDGTKVYQEDWSVPPVANCYSASDTTNPDSVCNGDSHSQWLWGVSGSNAGNASPKKFTFGIDKNLNDAALFSNKVDAGKQALGGGQGSSPFINDNDTGNQNANVETTGMYGWFFGSYDGNPALASPIGAGVMMPLQWTVTGSIL